MWKSSVWRNQTTRKITEVLVVVAAVGVDTGISQQY
jgi:cytochrome bd-type quinol oxidase subunit 1